MQYTYRIACFIVLLTAGCGKELEDGNMSGPEGERRVNIGGEDFVIVPSTASDERVNELGLPTKGREDVSHLLTPPPNLPKDVFVEDRDFRPQDAVEWVIDIEFDGNPVLSAAEISQQFDHKWLAENGRPTIFGWSPEISRWTYLISADSPKTFTKLAIAWELFKPFDEKHRITSSDLERFQRVVQQQAAKLGKPSLKMNRTTTEAEARSKAIREAVANCNRDVIVVLRAPPKQPFAGREVWDVMMSLGLRWGDADLFHWENDAHFGHDLFFSVETSTPPGYFLPERIVAGKTRLEDLVFGFSIPRSADAQIVLDSMLRAVSYAQDRLGGQILDRSGKPLDESKVREDTKAVVEKLKASGFEPGATATLQVF
jgi:cell division protein ZipA